MNDLHLRYPEPLRSLWSAGKVHDVWFWEHSGLFDNDDLRLARNQYWMGHFGEWFTAIHFWKRGYKVLIEKYIHKSHPKKLPVSEWLLGQDRINFLKQQRYQAPDLLVHKSRKEFFFAEVKVSPDDYHGSQQDYFKRLERKFGWRILTIRLTAKK